MRTVRPSLRSVLRQLLARLILSPVCVAALSALLGSATGALAGAFNLPEDQGLAIFDMTFSEGSRYFDGNGKMAPVDKFKRGDGYLYLEYGITDWLMAIVQPDLTAVSLDGHPGGHYIGMGTSQAGLQVQLLTFGPAVFAVQGSFRMPGSTDRNNRALLGNTSHDAEGRGLMGISFAIGPYPAFIDAQAGYRYRDSGAPGEIHADLTLGVRPIPELQILLQGFNTTSIGPGTDRFPNERYTHVQVAAVYDFTEAWSVELGVFTTVLGHRSLREQGVTTAVWYRF
jgi:protein XagA